jgi:chromosome segregation ATPase
MGILEKLKLIKTCIFISNNVLEKLEEISCAVNRLDKKINNIEDNLHKNTTKLKTTLANHEQAVEKFVYLTKVFEKEIDNLRNELYEVKGLESRLPDMISKILEENLILAVSRDVAKLRSDVEKYTVLKTKVNELGTSIDTIISELKRLSAVSTKIKDADFEFRRLNIELDKAYSEKYRLKKRIDKLEELIAKERRRSYRR